MRRTAANPPLTFRGLLSDTPPASPPPVDLVIPIFNEAEVAAVFHQQLRAAIDALPNVFAILYVDDGSTDGTLAKLQEIAAHDPRVRIIELSRNFGHQAALTAGLDQSTADIVISLDGDGEHPPQLIPQMLELAASGYDVVLTQRVEAQRARVFKRWTSDAFYGLINRIGSTHILPGSGDFRLMKRSVVDALCNMREYQRFLRGMVAWMGYKTVILPYTPADRLGGQSKYSLRKMLRLATNAIFSFSLVPLYIAISVGALFLLLALAEMIYVLSFWITGRQASLAPGWSSLMFVLLVVGGALMITLGFVGIYIGYIFQESKRRPIYLIRGIHTQGAPETEDD
jgi:glycosyltransferase involved in cell wall biosynthesis